MVKKALKIAAVQQSQGITSQAWAGREALESRN